MIKAFLVEAGWAKARVTPLAADASSRRYHRVLSPVGSAVLMQAPVAEPSDRRSFAAFRRIGAHLRGLGLSAPREIYANPSKGLILMEDLGDLTLSRLLSDNRDLARHAYAATVELLPRLQAPPPEGLAAPDMADLARMVGITFDLLPDAEDLRMHVLGALTDALTRHAFGPAHLALRDVHGDNLIWLPSRTGEARVGLLDFQDALLLPAGYDLASLLDDPRREVPETWRDALIKATGTDPRQIAILSLQRNLRILGIFRRLATQLGKPSYARFLPRTRACIERVLDDLPELSGPVGDLLARTAPWDEVHAL